MKENHKPYNFNQYCHPSQTPTMIYRSKTERKEKYTMKRAESGSSSHGVWIWELGDAGEEVMRNGDIEVKKVVGNSMSGVHLAMSASRHFYN